MSPLVWLLGRLSDAGKPGRVLAPEADLIRSLGWRATRDLHRAERSAGAWMPTLRRLLYQEIWEEAAQTLGATLHPLTGDFLLMEKEGARTVVSYQTVMLDNEISLLLAKDKAAAHALLGQLGIPTATHIELDAADRATGRTFVEGRRVPCVVKPAANTSGGEGVTCGVANAADLERARLWARRWDRRLLLEEQALGSEYRLLFLDGELLDIVLRRPPCVIGDGMASVAELIAAENARRESARGRAGTSSLQVDLDCLLALQRKGLDLASVPARGRLVEVKAATNQSSGAQNRTVRPGEVGPALIAEAATAIRAVGLRFGGVDVITPDPRRSLRDAGGIVVEVNGTPGFQYHYLVADPANATRVAVPVLAALLDRERTPSFPASG
ncbi:MAG: hypothetical protein M3Y36_01435 [Actinomycetota bacterium]|nr:hypothetical protein [Actinomycetota bacterium]